MSLSVFDVELTLAQQVTLEDAFGGGARGVEFLDRTARFLDIFAHHAATKEGKLQVQLALYQYRITRLTRLHLEGQSAAGGVGLRSSGETQLEVNRRLHISKMERIRE